MRRVMIWFFANPENIYSPISPIKLYELYAGEDFGDYIEKWISEHSFDTDAIAYKQHKVVITTYQTILEDSWTWIPDDADWDEYGIKEEDE